MTKQHNDELDAILDLIWGGALDVTTSKDFKDSSGDLNESKYVIAKYSIQKIAKQKLDEHYKKKYLALVPEKKPFNSKISSNETGNIMYSQGYNQAVDE